jgi:hypothetical protein
MEEKVAILFWVFQALGRRVIKVALYIYWLGRVFAKPSFLCSSQESSHAMSIA